MTYISPLLQTKLKMAQKTPMTSTNANNNNTNFNSNNSSVNLGYSNYLNSNNYDKVYEDLRSRANTVKPNEARAKLVIENPIQASVSYVKDFKQDVNNLGQAVVNGKLSDFPLGRLNDLGLKLGSLIIAAALAKNSPTKTDAIMKFVGGATFIGSMSLWPKLFINLPARLVHGFRIDEKYISAQGDKKDFFLDNQFLPWDCYPKDRLMKNAKRAGIDPEDPNSEEKIQRKMQKTALQNRTLWMATAGFATPVMTSLICNRLEGPIQNAVVNHDLKKAAKVLASEENLENYLAAAKPEVHNRDAINKLFKEYSSKQLDDNFYQKLTEYMNLGIKSTSADDVKALDGTFSKHLMSTLKSLEAKQPVLTDESSMKALKDELSTMTMVVKQPNGTKSAKLAGLLKSNKGKANVHVPKFTEQQISTIMNAIKAEKEPTVEKVSAILKANGVDGENKIKSLTGKLKYDNTAFFASIKDYNENVLSVIRGRIKSYNKLINHVTGSRAESAYTKVSTNSINSLFDTLNLSDKELRTLATGSSELFDPKTNAYQFDDAREVLIKAFQKFAKDNQKLAEENPEEYTKKLQEFISGKPSKFKGRLNRFMGGKLETNLSDTVSKLSDRKMISMITNVQTGANKEMHKELTEAIFGSKNGVASVYDRMFKFIKNESINLDATQNKALLCANLERRILDGSFKQGLTDKGLISDNTPFEDFVRVARKMIYDNSVSLDACKGEMQLTGDTYGKLKEVLYDASQYEKEAGVKIKDVMKSFGGTSEGSLKDLVGKLKNLGTTSQDYSRASSFFQMAQNTAKKMSNTRSWMKGCGIFAAALVAVTLLAQPFFGNIKNEFPDNPKKKGGAE